MLAEKPLGLAPRGIALIVLCTIFAAFADSSSEASSTYTPTAANLAAREWFQDAKFGLWIHWGIYSLLGKGEWVMHVKKIGVTEYENLASRFNPTDFDPAEWVALAKTAGMKYITITSKHHDGFCMFHTRQTDWNIVDRTPYGKDGLEMLAEECRKQGIKLFFYYSHLDWHHPDDFPRGDTGQFAGRPAGGNWYRYLDYMDAQIRELCTRYGELGGIWFDGWWDRPDADWRLARTYALIHSLQPQALITNNHHRLPFPGEDFQTWEKDLPGQRTVSFNQEAQVGQLPLESSNTINGSWGYNKSDKEFKSTRELLHYLIRAGGFNSNFLLDVAVMPGGKIQPEFVQRLKEMGRWLAANGESIYGTRGGPLSPRPWGVTTRKGNIFYIHILDWKDNVLALPKLPAKVKAARLLKDGRRVEFADLGYGFVLNLPRGSLDPIDTIVVLETVGEDEDKSCRSTQSWWQIRTLRYGYWRCNNFRYAGMFAKILSTRTRVPLPKNECEIRRPVFRSLYPFAYNCRAEAQS